jgi:S-adenosylmethionine synthetase
MMFGYATRETKALMPMPIQLAHQLARQLAEVRKAQVIPYLGPDGKTQITVRYENDRPVEVAKVLVSTQHREEAGEQMIRNDLWEHVLEPVLHTEYKELYTEKELLDNFMVNPTGKFVIGGPVGDAGLTGRKIIVDTYGGAARHGGGAFSGRTRRRSTAQPPTRLATSLRTSLPPASPTAARCRSRTRSASPIRSR